MKTAQHIGAGALDIEHLANGQVLVSVPLVPALGYASSTPIPSFCSTCKRPQPATPHVLLTSLYQRVSTHKGQLYGSLTVCEFCRKD